MEEREEFYGLKKLVMCLALVSVILAIRHLVIPAMIVSGITIAFGGLLFLNERKSEIKVASNLALWSTLIGAAMFLSVVLFDVLHI